MDGNEILIDLKVQSDLIDPNFESYRLSIDPTIIDHKKLTYPVQDFTLEDKQLYSYLHFRSFSSINHLFSDPFINQSSNKAIAFWVDDHFNVWSILKDENHFSDPYCVFTMSENALHSDYLVTLSFPSPVYALLLLSKRTENRKIQKNQCDSQLNAIDEIKLFIFETNDRYKNHKWHILKTLDLKKISGIPIEAPAKILYSKSFNSFIHLVIYFVIKDKADKFASVLSWVILDMNFAITRILQLKSKSYPYYLALEEESEENRYISIVSEKPFIFIYDSAIGLIEEIAQDEKEKMEDDSRYIFLFYQTANEITVNFKLPKDLDSRDIDVKFTSNELSIKIEDENILKNKLYGEIDVDNSTWLIQRDQKFNDSLEPLDILELSLFKKNAQIWPRLTEDYDKGFEIMGQDNAELYRGLSFIKSEMISTKRKVTTLLGLDAETCDQASQDLCFIRYSSITKLPSHRIDLGGHQWLFTCNNDPYKLPLFVMRHDVDALIWQPKVENHKFTVEHISTFSALGYVQASKESKKYMNFSLDLEYAFIAEPNNHLFLYHKPQKSTVRNVKKGICAKIGKQKVINLSKEFEKIIGCRGFVNNLLVLTTSHIFCILMDF